MGDKGPAHKKNAIFLLLKTALQTLFQFVAGVGGINFKHVCRVAGCAPLLYIKYLHLLQSTSGRLCDLLAAYLVYQMFYFVTGGLTVVIYTDFLQAALMITGAVYLTVQGE